MNSYDQDLIDKLVSIIISDLNEHRSDLEKSCWMVVHQYHHGVKPSEYDIREIDESLYLQVLKITKEKLED